MDPVERLQATILEISDPRRVMQRVVDQALVLLETADGAVVELVDGDQLVYASAAGTLSEHLGHRLAIDGSLSGLAVRTGETLYCRDQAVDPRVDSEACRAVSAISLVCVPLRQGSTRIGALKVSSKRTAAFSDEDVATLRRLAEFISLAIGAVAELSRVADQLLTAPGVAGGAAEPRDRGPGAGGADRRRELGHFIANVMRPGLAADLAARQRIEQTLTDRRYTMVVQPIVDVASGAAVGVEALARFSGPPAQPPNVWFDEAEAAGLGTALQLAAVETALGLLPELSDSLFVAVNVGPELIATRELQQLLAPQPSSRLVLELTEHLRIDDYPQLRSALEKLRRSGVRLAIDDTGAGFSSLAHIVHLAPDLIKLDRQLTRGIDFDPVRRALATALVSFASDTGAEVVAEGVETSDEFEAICDLGIPLAQGYFIARPTPLTGLPQRLPHIAGLVGDRAR